MPRALASRIVPGESQNDASEQRHQQAVVNDGVGNVRSQPQHEEEQREPRNAEQKAHAGDARNELVQLRQHHAEDKAGQMRQRREFERLQPRARRESVGMRNAVGTEDDVERARNQANEPDRGQAAQDRSHAFRPLPPRQPGKQHVVKRLRRHGPGGRVQEGGDLRNPSLQEAAASAPCPSRTCGACAPRTPARPHATPGTG